MKCLPPITSAAVAVFSGRRAFVFGVPAAQVQVRYAHASSHCLGVIALLTGTESGWAKLLCTDPTAMECVLAQPLLCYGL